MHSLLRRVRTELTLRRLSPQERLTLGAIGLCALVLYIALEHDRAFLGDEVGTLKYLKRSPGYLLTHFTSHLSMNYFILAEKAIAWLCGATDWRLILLPLAAAVAVIPLTASLALKFTGSTRTALMAACLAAFNPYLVSWSTVIRSYSLLVACSLLALNEFFNWYRQRDWWSGARCAAAVLLLLLVHLNGVYTVAILMLFLAFETISAGWSGGRRFLWESRTLTIPLAGVAMIVGVAYWRLLPDIAKVNREWGTDTPPTSMGYLPHVFTLYVGTGGTAIFVALLLLAGVWSAVRERRAVLLVCGAIILAPIVMSLQGLAVYSSTYARYLIFSLPLLLVLLAEGIDWLARHARLRRGAAVVAWGLTVIIGLCWAPLVYAQFLVKQQRAYAQVAKFLHAQMQNDDVIVTGWGIGFTLGQFFDGSENRIMLPNTYISKVATQFEAGAVGRVFYVTELGLLNDRKAPVHRFGGLEVTTYSGDTARALLHQWREDLLQRTAGRVVASFQADYQLLALIEEHVPSGRSVDYWRSLAERCRAQRADAAWVPRHLQKATRETFFN